MNETLEDGLEQYRALSREFRRITREELRTGNYPHLRGNSQPKNFHRDVKDFMKNRFRIDILARPPFIEGKGHSNVKVANTQAILFIHGNFVDSRDFKSGYEVSHNPLQDVTYRYIRTDPLSWNMFNFLSIVDQILCFRDHKTTAFNLRNGHYEPVVKNILSITNYAVKSECRRIYGENYSPKHS